MNGPNKKTAQTQIYNFQFNRTGVATANKEIQEEQKFIVQTPPHLLIPPGQLER